MKFTIELSVYEVKEAVSRGLINAIASLAEPAADTGKPTRVEAKQQAQILPTPAAVPTQPIEAVATSAQPTVPVRAVPTQPVDPAAQQAIQQPIQTPQQPAAPTAVPTQAATYTQEQLALAASQLMEAKKDQSVVVNLLSKFGVQALTQLPKEQYGAFATELRGLGAKL